MIGADTSVGSCRILKGTLRSLAGILSEFTGTLVVALGIVSGTLEGIAEALKTEGSQKVRKAIKEIYSKPIGIVSSSRPRVLTLKHGHCK